MYLTMDGSVYHFRIRRLFVLAICLYVIFSLYCVLIETIQECKKIIRFVRYRCFAVDSYSFMTHSHIQWYQLNFPLPIRYLLFRNFFTTRPLVGFPIEKTYYSLFCLDCLSSSVMAFLQMWRSRPWTNRLNFEPNWHWNFVQFLDIILMPSNIASSQLLFPCLWEEKQKN